MIRLLPLLLLTGCAVVSPQIPKDEVGLATQCLWVKHTPITCQLDETRGTVNLEYLQDLFDELEEYKHQARHRRSL
jgi:hypothetical protein